MLDSPRLAEGSRNRRERQFYACFLIPPQPHA
jgi:hypothetical protein